MDNYLDLLPEYTSKAQIKIAALALEAATIINNGGAPYQQIDNINWFVLLLQGSTDTALNTTLRLQLLTLLVDNARLNEVPLVNVFGLYQMLGDSTITATQWDLILGDPATSASLVAYVLARTSFPADQPIVLSSGKSFGKYVNGDTAPWQGLTWGQAIIDSVTEYLIPSFTSFAISGITSPLETGTIISGGGKTATWGTTNSGNVEANSITIEDTTAGIVLVADTANDGTQAITFPTNVQRTTPGTHIWTITGFNTEGDNFDRQLVVAWQYKRFFGPSATNPTTSAAFRGLSSTFGNTFTLNTGTSDIYFAIWINTGLTITSIIDLDALNLDVLSDFITSSFSVNDAAGTPVTGTKYLKTNGVPYPSNHRLLVTVA